MGEDLRERDHLVELGVDRIPILKWIFSRRDGEEWSRFDLAQNRERWQTLVNAVMNLRVLQDAANFLTS